MSDKTLLSQRTMLEEANAFVLEQRKNVNEFYKPLYHFSPPCGWMNDPNGLVYFRGEYHVFYQFHPYSSQGGLMYWGHAKSRNFTTWEHLPVALAPDAPYDKNGCWSGGAIVIEDVLYLIYTGHYDENGERRQTQNIAFSRDGIHFEKYAGNPVIEAASAPMGVSKADFRDPFVWKKDGKYYCLLGTLQNGVPTALLYRSENFFDWEFFNIFLQRENSGYCYECPNMTRIGDTDVLFLSPVDFPADGFAFTNCNSVVYSSGKIDYQKGCFGGSPFREVDGGTDFYATQVVYSPEGKSILLAWMNLWNRTMVTDQLGHGWQGMMTLPRELNIKDGKLLQRPAQSLSECLKNPVTVNDTLTGEKSYAGIEGRTLCLRVKADISSCRRFGVKVLSDGEHFLSAVYDKERKQFTIDRRKSLHVIKGHAREQGSEEMRVLPYDCGGSTFKMEIWLDRCAAEVFLGDGEGSLSMLVYNGNGGKVYFFAEGKAELHIEKGEVVPTPSP